jgi:general secretion pathway protein J
MKKTPRGFTLLEVLIAMSLLGIMLVLLFGSFAICSRSWNAGEEHIHKVEQMAMVQNFFRSRLSAAWNESGLRRSTSNAEEDADAGGRNPQKNDAWAFFQGEEHYLQFVALLPESAARGGWYLFKVGVKADSAALYVALTPFLPVDERQPPEAETLEILPDLENFTLAYWGKKDADDAPQWHTQWLDMPALPELVSINVKLHGQNAWPTLVAAPRLAPASAPEQAGRGG